MTRAGGVVHSRGIAEAFGGAGLFATLNTGLDVLAAELPVEVRCLSAFELHGHRLADLSKTWDADVATGDALALKVAYRKCSEFEGCETAALHVKLQMIDNYLQRLEISFWMQFASGVEAMLGESIRSKVRAAFNAWEQPRIVCLPEACAAFGNSPVLRAVLWKLALHQDNSSTQLPPPAAEEVVLLSRLVHESGASNGLVAVRDRKRGRLHSLDDQGLCVCSDAPVWASGGQWNHLSIRFAQAPVTGMLAATDMGGVTQRRLLKGSIDCPAKLYAGALTFTVQMQTIENALKLGTEESSCIPGLLNSALLCALAAKSVHAESPGAFLAKLETVLHLALLARHCPGGMLRSYVGVCGVAPPVAFGVHGVLRQHRIALAGFGRGKKALGHSSLWRDPEDMDTSCNHAAVEAEFLRLAGVRGETRGLPESNIASSAILPPPPDANNVRIMCLYPASWPRDSARIESVAKAFATRCDNAKFFVSSSREGPKSWYLAPEHGEYEVLNLAALYDNPLMTEDSETFMNTGSRGWASKQKVFRGNLIVKVLAMLVVTARIFNFNAEIFCRLDLDTVFIPENLKAFARAMRISADDSVFLGVQNYFWKYTHGVFPDGGAGICLTRRALSKLAAVLESLPTRFTEYDRSQESFWMRRFADQSFEKCEFQEGHWDDLVLGQCLRVANVTPHPALEDRLGRAYATPLPMPCWEHLMLLHKNRLARRPPRWRSRRKQLTEVMFDRLEDGSLWPSEWAHQMHRYVPCEPSASDWTVGPSYWLSPFAFSFHNYKDLDLYQHAYNVIYCGGSCNWTFGYRLNVFNDRKASGCGQGKFGSDS